MQRETEELGLPEYTCPHEFYADRSPEYWAGWVLAYFQWKTRFSFKMILQKAPVEKNSAYIPQAMSGMSEMLRIFCLSGWAPDQPGFPNQAAYCFCPGKMQGFPGDFDEYGPGI